MKNKIVIILALSAIFSCGYVILASNPDTVLVQSESLDTPPGEKIILLGNLLFGINPNAIEASVTDDAVFIQFNQNLGNVSIAICNGNGQQVYSSIVDTSVQQAVVIPFTTAVADTYTVIINNANGYVEGDFDKN